jgi:hypothetical protein
MLATARRTMRVSAARRSVGPDAFGLLLALVVIHLSGSAAAQKIHANDCKHPYAAIGAWCTNIHALWLTR